jgi:hypothetical protein
LHTTTTQEREREREIDLFNLKSTPLSTMRLVGRMGKAVMRGFSRKLVSNTRAKHGALSGVRMLSALTTRPELSIQRAPRAEFAGFTVSLDVIMMQPLDDDG